ncbi:MAG: hypothetical protein ABI378_14520 [Chitinophagaceae bacterium]
MNIRKLIIGIIAFSFLSFAVTFGGIYFLGHYLSKNALSPDSKVGQMISKASGHLIGPQPPKWESGTFSAIGDIYAYTYNIENVLSYSSRWGSRVSYTSYFQIIDCTTGSSLLQKPIKSEEILTIIGIEGNSVILNSFQISPNRWGIAVFDISSRKMKFNAEDIAKINQEIPINVAGMTFYKSAKIEGQLLFEGSDGRKYHLNPETGKVALSAAEGINYEQQNADCYQLVNRVKGINTTNGTRVRFYTGNSRNHDVESADDFLNPKFLALNNSGGKEEREATIYNGKIIVLSPNSVNDYKDQQLTMLDKATLKTNWSITLAQDEQKENNYRKERFIQKGNQLFIANSSNLTVLNLDDGTIIKNQSLFQKTPQ